MKSFEVVVDGRKVAYWQHGAVDGVPLVLLHGLGGDHRGLQELAAHLANYNVLIPDLPGYGRSETMPGRQTLANYAAFVEKFRSRLELGDIYLAGHSFGATTALIYAATYPNHLRKLCLMSPVTESQSVMAGLGKLYYTIAGKLPKPLARFWLTNRLAVFITDELILRTPDRARRKQILDWDYAAYKTASIDALVQGFLSFSEEKLHTYPSAVVAPTLVLGGDKDPLADPATLRTIEAAMPHASTVIVAGGGHLLPVEEPLSVAGQLDTFFTGTIQR